MMEVVPLKAPFVNYFRDDFASLPPAPCAAAFSFYHLSFCVMFVNSTVVAFFRFSLFRCNLYVCSWKVLVGGSLTFLPLEPCNFQERKPLEKKKVLAFFFAQNGLEMRPNLVICRGKRRNNIQNF